MYLRFDEIIIIFFGFKKTPPHRFDEIILINFELKIIPLIDSIVE